MSLPSDNEDFKKEEENLSNRDSSSDESKDVGPDGKKKRKTKKASKPAGVLGDLKTSPGTSGKSKTGESGNEPKDAECSGKTSGSDSGDKNVGEVREDIEQLKLNEEKAEEEKAKTKILEVSRQLQTGPGIGLLSQPGTSASGTIGSIEEIQPTPEDVDTANANDPDVPRDANIQTLSSSFSIHRLAPPNTINESYEREEMSKNSSTTCSSKVNRKRESYAQNADNTLDDVSDITSDFSDIQTDSSSGRRTIYYLAGQDAPLDETDESSVSEFDSVKSEVELQGKCDNSEELPEDKKQNLDEFQNLKDDSTSQSNSEDPSGSSAPDKVDEKGGSSKSDSVDEEHVSDEKVNLRKKDHSNEAGPSGVRLGHEVRMDEQSGSDMGAGVEAMGDLVSDQNEESKELASKDGSLDMEKNADVVEPEQEDLLDERVVREEMDDSISVQDNSGNQGGSGEQRSGIEQVSDQDGSGLQGTSDDQSNVVGEASGGQEVDEQENSENYDNFAGGQFVRYPIDSSNSNSDSGFDNSDAVFVRNNRPNELAQYEVPAAFQDNSEDNSSLAASGFAGLNNLQLWIGAGGHDLAPEPVPLVAPNQPVQLIDGSSSNAPSIEIDQPSTSSDWPGPGVVYLAKQQHLNVPMEFAEQFDSQNSTNSFTGQSEGENLEPNPASLNLDPPSNEAMEGELGQRPISSGADLEKEGSLDDEKNGNANQGAEDLLKKLLPASMDPETSRRLSRDDSEQLSNSSLERSQDRSHEDMYDAVDSSEKSKSEDLKRAPKVLRSDEEPLLMDEKSIESPRSDERPLLVGEQPTEVPRSDRRPLLIVDKSTEVPRSDGRPLLVGDKGTAGCSKQKVHTKPSQKRLAKSTAEKKLKKKRKGVTLTCREQALSNVDALMETSSSEEESNL